MRFDILTIFPHIFDSYLQESILKRAQAKKLITIKTHDLRAWARDKHKKVDDTPYSGGPGMIFKVEPIVRALGDIVCEAKKKIVLFDPAGKQFTHARARRYAKLDQLILVCGRYEGFDDRVKAYVDESVSIGPYVLSGGELPAMVVVEAVARLRAGVLGNAESLVQETHFVEGYVEYPQYTRPEVFDGHHVPEVLLQGDHKKIAEWKKRHTKKGR